VHRYPLALASGLALWLAFPSQGLWFMAPAGVGLLALATRRSSARQGALLGLLGGLACFVPLLSWSGVYVGTLPWVALAVLESLYVALLGLVCALFQTGPSVAGPGRVRPLAVALVWVAQEALRGSTPFGGFPWGRLAFSQADSPLAGLAALGGAPALTFGVALVGGLLASGVAQLMGNCTPQRAGQHGRNRSRGRAGGGRAGGGSSDAGGRGGSRSVLAVTVGTGCAVTGAIAVLLLPLMIPRPTDGPTGRFLAVQGNVPRPGLDFNAERRAVLDNHARATRAVAEKARPQPTPDLVVWPENASDIDPLRNADAGNVIQDAVEAISAPIVLGALLEGPGPTVSNASLLYRPGLGLTARYVKRHPVPFAEYIPYRSFFRLFSDKVDLVRTDFSAGTSVGVFRVPARTGGEIAAGAVICFEVAYDQLLRDNIDNGANVLLVQTNNATFGFTDESVQQLAISRIRAIEHGRSIVHISTVGVSAMITPDGTAHQPSALFTSAALASDLPLRTDRTLADRLGPWPELLATAAVGAMLLLLLVRAAARSRASLRWTALSGARTRRRSGR